MNPLLIACEPGLELLQVAELHALGYEAEVLKPSKVLVRRRDEHDIVFLNYHLRQMSRVLLILKRCEVESLDDIAQVAAELDYAPFLTTAQTFGARGVRIGDHDFTSTDIGRVVGGAVIDFFLRTRGERPAVHLDAPDVWIRAELSDTTLVIAVDTTGDSMIRRHSRVFQHFAPLRPTIAAAMLSLGGFGADKPVLDPLAGGGTIPAEAALTRMNVPPGYFRESFAYERIPCIEHPPAEELHAQAMENFRACDVRIGASDRATNSLRGMASNFDRMGVADAITLWEDDAERLEGVERGDYRLLVTNPPFGQRIGRPALVKRLYDRLPVLAAEKGITEIVTMTPNGGWMVAALEQAGWTITHRIRFLYGDLPTMMYRAVLDPGGDSPSKPEPAPVSF